MQNEKTVTPRSAVLLRRAVLATVVLASFMVGLSPSGALTPAPPTVPVTLSTSSATVGDVVEISISECPPSGFENPANSYTVNLIVVQRFPLIPPGLVQQLPFPGPLPVEPGPGLPAPPAIAFDRGAPVVEIVSPETPPPADLPPPPFAPEAVPALLFDGALPVQADGTVSVFVPTADASVGSYDVFGGCGSTFNGFALEVATFDITDGTPICNGLPATIVAKAGIATVGTPGPDVIVGTAAADTIDGRGGHDHICGLGGEDELTGGGGSDVLLGGDGSDRLKGGGGGDHLAGGDGKDVLLGAKGVDELLGGDGADRLIGGAGNDFAMGGSGNDKLLGGGGGDVLDGGFGNDLLKGGGGDDFVQGNFGDNRAFGGKGNDIVIGSQPEFDFAQPSLLPIPDVGFASGGPGDDEVGPAAVCVGGSGTDNFFQCGTTS